MLVDGGNAHQFNHSRCMDWVGGKFHAIFLCCITFCTQADCSAQDVDDENNNESELPCMASDGERDTAPPRHSLINFCHSASCAPSWSLPLYLVLNQVSKLQPHFLNPAPFELTQTFGPLEISPNKYRNLTTKPCTKICCHKNFGCAFLWRYFLFL